MKLDGGEASRAKNRPHVILKSPGQSVFDAEKVTEKGYEIDVLLKDRAGKKKKRLTQKKRKGSTPGASRANAIRVEGRDVGFIGESINGVKGPKKKTGRLRISWGGRNLGWVPWKIEEGEKTRSRAWGP